MDVLIIIDMQTALFDTPRMARDVERAFDAMVERSRQGLAPDHIVLDAA